MTMTPKQNWQGLVVHAKAFSKPPARVSIGIVWADDRIKALEGELKAVRFQKNLAEQSLNTLKGYVDSKAAQ